ncbi:MAG: ATP-binding cassette domain-containing protein [Hyphomicrobiaceae bacterium]|nr:ATP-binding cassette domain-containing protein [Hyphomicrobiaceae bacterium]
MSQGLRTVALSKSYGHVSALRGVSLAVSPGELVVVLGPSGSGKSTLFRCITRLTEPDGGEVYVGDRAVHGLEGPALAEVRREIGVVFQQFNLVRRRTALENVLAGRLGSAPLWRVAAGRFSRADLARAAAALRSVGLERQAHQRADTLSGGQQQRVAIARALAQESRVLLADEPVASLDPDSATAVLELMRGLTRSAGLAVLCTLHQPHLAERFADRVLRMEEGRLLGDAGRRPAASQAVERAL